MFGLSSKYALAQYMFYNSKGCVSLRKIVPKKKAMNHSERIGKHKKCGPAQSTIANIHVVISKNFEMLNNK